MGEHDAVYRPGQSGQTGSADNLVNPGPRGSTANQYGVDMRGTTDTTGQVRDRTSTTYDREHDGGLWNWLQRTFMKDGQVNSQVQQQTAQDASTLTAGVSTRSTPGIPTTNYMSVEHGNLKNMVKDGVDPGSSQDRSDVWITTGNAMVEHQQDFVGAIGASEGEWRGKAGDSARKFMADVANYIGKAGQSAQLAGKQESLHSQALSNAGNAMPDPIPFNLDAANADLKNTTDPFDYIAKYSKYEATYQASEQAHQQAADVVSTYDQSLRGASTLPSFDAPPQMGGSTPPQPKKIDDGGDSGHRGDRPGLSAVDSHGPDGPQGDTPKQGTGFPPGTGGPPGNGFPGGGVPGGGPGGGGGHGGGINPGGGPGSGGGTGVGPGGTGGQSYIPGAGGGGGGGAPLPNYGSPDAMPMGPMGGFGGNFDQGGSNYGGSRYGAGGGSEGGAGGRGGFGGGAGSGTGAGARGFGPGSGVGGLAAEQAAMGRGGAGGAGRGGMGGMGGMGGHKGEGGEDEEHQRASFLVEPDPDSTFGTDEITAPPVIGG
ncbi:hypothetical protein [Actinocrispum wychmicini]|uniref:PPE family protein n=1 Tax=Actinocrispum wychmicini TaxID=1213861 RepID=A0A4R2JZ93_9PSEU|nr:hypothetical protein [Actinocrispum wychmicini]TCO65284.1 hypothetical protein EV192_1011072 [Actinocrispum wychmicini]